MTANPKRQHTVPRLLLNNFVDQGGKLHCFDRKRDRTYTTVPDNVLVESHMYTLKLQGKPDSFEAERALSTLESLAARVIDRVVDRARAGRPPGLADRDMDVLDEFILLQFRRSWERLNSLKESSHAEDVLEEIIADVAHAHPADDVRAVTEQIDFDRLTRNSWIMSLGYGAPKWLRTKGLAVVHAPAPHDQLLIGSDPILLAGHDRRKPDGEVILPIASDVAISLAMTRGKERLLEDNRRRKLVRMINRHVFSQSHVVAAASPRTFERLVAADRKRARRQAVRQGRPRSLHERPNGR